MRYFFHDFSFLLREVSNIIKKWLQCSVFLWICNQWIWQYGQETIETRAAKKRTVVKVDAVASEFHQNKTK